MRTLTIATFFNVAKVAERLLYNYWRAIKNGLVEPNENINCVNINLNIIPEWAV